jgi:hypothetical protein
VIRDVRPTDSFDRAADISAFAGVSGDSVSKTETNTVWSQKSFDSAMSLAKDRHD